MNTKQSTFSFKEGESTVLRRTYKGFIHHLHPHQWLMFGSNTQGRHGKGAALYAIKWGAIRGQAAGAQGRTYAIVTKDLTKYTHPSIDPTQIVRQLKVMYKFMLDRPYEEMLIPYNVMNRNLNGYTAEDMAAMFYMNGEMEIPFNIVFEEDFAELVYKLKQDDKG